MIRAWKSAGWPVRAVMLVCVYIIVDSVTSLGSLVLTGSQPGDSLDRFTAVRVEQQSGKTVVTYSYLHANSSAQMTALHLADRDVPDIGAVRYRDPGGAQILLSDLAPADIRLRWSFSGRPAVTLPAGVLRQSDWRQRQSCLVKERTTRRVCWDAEHIDVD